MLDPIFQEIDPATNGDFHGKFADKPRSFRGDFPKCFCEAMSCKQGFMGIVEGGCTQQQKILPQSGIATLGLFTRLYFGLYLYLCLCIVLCSSEPSTKNGQAPLCL